MRALTEKPEGYVEREQRPRGERPQRRDGDRPRGDRPQRRDGERGERPQRRFTHRPDEKKD